MINFLRGTLAEISKESIIIDVSGFGVEVYPTKALLASAVVGEEIKCRTYMQVSDAGIAMFGFANETERDFFMELLHVKTIGGKLAIMLMRYLDLARIVESIKAGNVSALSVPGLGAKRAERICFELKSKVEKEFASIGAEIRSALVLRFLRRGGARGARLLARRMRARDSDGEGAGRRRHVVDGGDAAQGRARHPTAQVARC